MMKLPFVILKLLLVLSLFSCNQYVNSEEVMYENGSLVNKETKAKVTGSVIEYYSDGSISSNFSYENGLLEGEYILYGFENDIICEGVYVRVDFLDDMIKVIDFVDDYSFSLNKEGEVDYNELVIKINKKDLDEVDLEFLNSKLKGNENLEKYIPFELRIKDLNQNEIKYFRIESKNS